jgi:hypothetical protein
MFIIRKKFEISNHEMMDFVRLLGRFGMKFKVSEEQEIPNQDGKTKDRYRVFTVFGTRRQIREFMEARDIIYEYHLH